MMDKHSGYQENSLKRLTINTLYWSVTQRYREPKLSGAV
jgi:hypothetical protein